MEKNKDVGVKQENGLSLAFFCAGQPRQVPNLPYHQLFCPEMVCIVPNMKSCRENLKYLYAIHICNIIAKIKKRFKNVKLKNKTKIHSLIEK